MHMQADLLAITCTCTHMYTHAYMYTYTHLPIYLRAAAIRPKLINPKSFDTNDYMNWSVLSTPRVSVWGMS